MNRKQKHLAFLAGAVSVLGLSTKLALADQNAFLPPDYLKHVRSYADTLIQKGRDQYGAAHSPLFAVTLDKKTMKLPTPEEQKRLYQIRKDDWENWGIRNADRCFVGANPMQDQNLYQILYALSEVTGDRHYAEEADRTLKWFFENCQSKETGLLAWGEHIGWDFNHEAVVAKSEEELHHEFSRPWLLWDRSFKLSPGPCAQFADGLWEHQISDHKTGQYSRHAGYLKHRTDIGAEFPRHGGFYIATWAETYKRTKNKTLLTAIECLINYCERVRNPETGAIPCCTTPDRITIMWPESNLSLAVDLWNGASAVPAELAAKMRRLASAIDRVYLKLDHDFGPNGKGFVAGADTRTLKRKTEGGWTDTDMWATSYGKPTDAQVAMLCYMRYQQVKTDGLRHLVLQAAGRYVANDPDREMGLHPKTIGQVISLMLAAHEITGEKKYLDRAQHFGQMSVRLFLSDGPLPGATVKYTHYEAISGADTLMMALLDLWGQNQKPAKKLSLIFSDR